MNDRQVERAKIFRKLHRRGKILLLPCVWDVISAKLYESAGFEALGTTSAGLASTLGFPDGQRIGVEATATLVGRVTPHVGVPISADIEAGYGDDPASTARAARTVMDTGAVGLNLEDSLSGRGIAPHAPLRDVDEQAAFIAAVRSVANELGLPLFINARTDVLLVSGDPDDAALEEAIARGNSYLHAGAAGVFVPDMETLDEGAIARLAREIEGPLNLIAGARTPPVARLEALGVARLSFGPRAMRKALWHLEQMAREWRVEGTYDRMLGETLSYDRVNGWFSAD